MTIFNDTYIPYEFDDKTQCLNYILERCHKLKKSLKLIEMDSEHITVKCPLSADYLDIIGDENELYWLHVKLSQGNWYRPI